MLIKKWMNFLSWFFFIRVFFHLLSKIFNDISQIFLNERRMTMHFKSSYFICICKDMIKFKKIEWQELQPILQEANHRLFLGKEENILLVHL